MRIVVVIPYPIKRGTGGGVVSVAKNTVEGFEEIEERLKNENIELSIYSSRGDSFISTKNPSNSSSPIEYHLFKPKRPNWVFSDIQAFLNLKLLEYKPDLIHTHQFGFATAGPLLGIPTLFTLHGMVWKESEYPNSSLARLAKKVKTKKIPIIDSLVKEYVAISPYVIQEFQSNFGQLSTEFTIIENPISNAFFELDRDCSTNQILCPGMIRPRKNQLTLLKALGRIDLDAHDARAVFTGGIADHSYFEQIKETAVKYELGDNIAFTGHVSQNKLLDIYAKSSIVCLSSYQETAPMVVAEAMASGTPVIASAVGGTNYMVDHGKSGFLVDPSAEDEFAEKLRLLLSNQDLRNKMGAAGSEIADRWRPEVIANQLIDLYLNYE